MQAGFIGISGYGAPARYDLLVVVVTEYRLHYRGTLFPIRSGEVILGRSSYASIVVNNPLASREHAVVRSVGGRLEVADLGSKNGTYVNGKRIEGSTRVDAGDVVKIGTDTIEIARMNAQAPQTQRVATALGVPAPPPVVPHRRRLRPRGIKVMRNYASGASAPKAAGGAVAKRAAGG